MADRNFIIWFMINYSLILKLSEASSCQFIFLFSFFFFCIHLVTFQLKCQVWIRISLALFFLWSCYWFTAAEYKTRSLICSIFTSYFQTAPVFTFSSYWFRIFQHLLSYLIINQCTHPKRSPRRGKLTSLRHWAAENVHIWSSDVRNRKKCIKAKVVNNVFPFPRWQLFHFCLIRSTVSVNAIIANFIGKKSAVWL